MRSFIAVSHHLSYAFHRVGRVLTHLSVDLVRTVTRFSVRPGDACGGDGHCPQKFKRRWHHGTWYFG